jgi:DNA-binding transcriptional LysR family regulator
MPPSRLPWILVRFDWNDLRVFAAVLEHGSTARAAKALGVDQTTCARRIAALEAALGLELFTRDATGYQPTPAAEVLRPQFTPSLGRSDGSPIRRRPRPAARHDV